MTPNSPMMHRVKRSRSDRISPIPRKGRIRLILAVLVIICIVRIGPPIARKFELPLTASARDTAPDTLLQHATATDTGHANKKESGIGNLLINNPQCYTNCNSVIFDGTDSLVVTTSIDTTLQRSISKLMSRYHPLYGALIALNPVSGRILALVSYTGDSMPDLGGNLCFRSIFPAASIYKTITAATAIEIAGFSADCSVEYRGRSHTLYRSQLARKLDWSVELTFSKAYARSINSVFARIGIYEIGATKLVNFSNRFGFNQVLPGEISCDVSRVLMPDSLFDLAELASGFNQKTTLSPLHGALIAAGIAEKGLMPVPTLVDSVIRLGDHQKVYSRRTKSWLNPIRAATAIEMQKMMRAVVTSGTAVKQFRTLRNSRWFEAFNYGGKTGSVDKDGIGRVDWFIGYAAHKQETDECIAIGAVTAHGAYWTVHSSYLAAEAIRMYLKSVQAQKKEQQNTLADTPADSSSS